MNLPEQKRNYEKNPVIEMKGFENEAFQSYETILGELKKKTENLNKKKTVMVLDYYHGVDEKEVYENLVSKTGASKLINIEDYKLPEEQLSVELKREITEDRVFGVLSVRTIEEFFDMKKIEELRTEIKAASEGLIAVYGIGAGLIEGDILVYADMARWEIQQRFRRKELDNWGVGNFDEDVLKKYKRAFFIEWRVLDRHKRELFGKMDYLLDTNIKNDPKMISGDAFRAALAQAVNQPFRLVPFFDPGVWGGQWMKEVCGLDKSQEQYAWCFDGVPEENSLKLKYGNVVVEIPSIDLVFYKPVELLGDKVHARFGTEFPIRFDFLDTMGGGNLSLQVHPLTEYIQAKFGMHYTQDESYYMLDSGDDGSVYLGTKTGVKPEELIEEFRKAQRGEGAFPDEKYINKFPAKKHDHFLIPAGTIHCSGKNAMILEISATPFIFTFKLWDWGRVGLDGLPRPIHIEHGKENIQYNRNTEWVEANLINRIDKISEGDGWREERTGLHDREFIETRRHWFSKKVTHNTNGLVNMLNLVEGEEAIIESPENKFEPYIVHYAETFIIPANIGEYTIRPHGGSEGKEIATIKAFVRV
ncbi:mannose-6-phosphate isomerase [Sebaldella sp. S0638]|uniref:mannose-6-phosphate isomerase n=1 Tax=Sebaldella sp. S0638 TaxID=2957809 RepID=UPI0020A12BCD|nr:mannose-6-phosphate isomerase [Sebaldella sp. S0638]MCP1225948.1 mannose-6-phosphate isomerase [Sebaldella sp. S0638]